MAIHLHNPAEDFGGQPFSVSSADVEDKEVRLYGGYMDPVTLRDLSAYEAEAWFEARDLREKLRHARVHLTVLWSLIFVGAVWALLEWQS